MSIRITLALNKIIRTKDWLEQIRKDNKISFSSYQYILNNLISIEETLTTNQ